MPGPWRAITALAAIACLAVCAQSAAGAELVDPAHIPANPLGTIAASADSSLSARDTAGSMLGDADRADLEFHRDAGDASGGSASSPNPPSVIPHGVDWCRWWAFETAADNLQLDPSLDVYAELEGDLYNCLTTSYPGDPTVSWVAPYLALQNLASLLVAVHQAPDLAAAYNQLTGAVSLPTQTWIAWLRASALSLE